MRLEAARRADEKMEAELREMRALTAKREAKAAERLCGLRLPGASGSYVPAPAVRAATTAGSRAAGRARCRGCAASRARGGGRARGREGRSSRA